MPLATHLAGVRDRLLSRLSDEEQQALGDVCERIVSDGDETCD